MRYIVIVDGPNIDKAKLSVFKKVTALKRHMDDNSIPLDGEVFPPDYYSLYRKLKKLSGGEKIKTADGKYIAIVEYESPHIIFD